MADDSLELICPPYNNNPELWPHGMEPYKPEILSPEQQEAIRKKRVITAREDQKYLGDHPEVNAIVALILRGVLAHRPKCVHEFMGELMTRPTLARDVAAYLQQEMNTVVDLETLEDEGNVEEQDEGYKRVSRVSFQVEKNTTTFFDEFFDSSGNGGKKPQQPQGSAPYGSQHADCSMHPDAMSRKTDSVITTSTHVGAGQDVPSTKLVRSVSDYYIPGGEDGTTDSRRQSLEATFTMSDTDPITISSTQSVDDSKINVMDGSEPSLQGEQVYTEPEEQTDDKTISRIQNKLDSVCSDFRYMNEEESGMLMHVAGIADRRRSVLPSREALAARFSEAAGIGSPTTSASGSRTASTTNNNMTSFRRSIHALTYNPTGSVNSFRQGDVSPAFVDSRRGSAETRQASNAVISTTSANDIVLRNFDHAPTAEQMTPSAAQSIMPLTLSSREMLDSNRSNQNSAHASLSSFADRMASRRQSMVNSMGSLESSRFLRKVQISSNEVYPEGRPSISGERSMSSVRNSLSSFKSRLGSQAGMSAKGSISSARRHSDSVSPGIPDIAQAVVGGAYESVAANLEKASEILSKQVSATPLIAQSLQAPTSRRASLLVPSMTPPVISRQWSFRGNETEATTSVDPREVDDIVVEYIETDHGNRNPSVATEYSTTSSENVFLEMSSPPAGHRAAGEVDIPEIAQSIAMGGAHSRRSVMGPVDVGYAVERSKMRSSVAAEKAEKARMRSSEAEENAEKAKYRSSVAGENAEKVRLRSNVPAENAEKARLRSNVAAENAEKARLRSSVAVAAEWANTRRSVAGENAEKARLRSSVGVAAEWANTRSSVVGEGEVLRARMKSNAGPTTRKP